MINVSSGTLINGVSHIVPSTSKLPLLTTHGAEVYGRKRKLFEQAKKTGNLDYYKRYLFQEQQNLSKELSHLLLDDDSIKRYKMNDEDITGWTMYRELSDEYTVVTYFLNK